MSKEIKCTFTSIWDDGTTVTTPCTYDPKTGEVTPELSNAHPKGSLTREFITLPSAWDNGDDPDGDELEVCDTCHEYVLKTVVGDRADKSYGEMQVCSNPDCENN